jgi:hypothetical protein
MAMRSYESCVTGPSRFLLALRESAVTTSDDLFHANLSSSWKVVKAGRKRIPVAPVEIGPLLLSGGETLSPTCGSGFRQL